MSAFNFRIPKFDTTIKYYFSASRIGQMDGQMDYGTYDSIARYNIPLTEIQTMFSATSTNMDQLYLVNPSADINYYTLFPTQGTSFYTLNVSQATLTTDTTGTRPPVGYSPAGPITLSGDVVNVDSIKYIANELFNSPNISIFSNVPSLSADIFGKCSCDPAFNNNDSYSYTGLQNYDNSNPSKITPLFANIMVSIANVCTASNTSYSNNYLPLQADGPGNSYMTNANTSSDNLCRTLYQQMATYRPDRFDSIQYTSYDNETTNKFPLPFMVGDTISLNLTIEPADGQGDVVNPSVIVNSRNYRILLNVVE